MAIHFLEQLSAEEHFTAISHNSETIQNLIKVELFQRTVRIPFMACTTIFLYFAIFKFRSWTTAIEAIALAVCRWHDPSTTFFGFILAKLAVSFVAWMLNMFTHKWKSTSTVPRRSLHHMSHSNGCAQRRRVCNHHNVAEGTQDSGSSTSTSDTTLTLARGLLESHQDSAQRQHESRASLCAQCNQAECRIHARYVFVFPQCGFVLPYFCKTEVIEVFELCVRRQAGSTTLITYFDLWTDRFLSIAMHSFLGWEILIFILVGGYQSFVFIIFIHYDVGGYLLDSSFFLLVLFNTGFMSVKDLGLNRSQCRRAKKRGVWIRFLHECLLLLSLAVVWPIVMDVSQKMHMTPIVQFFSLLSLSCLAAFQLNRNRIFIACTCMSIGITLFFYFFVS